METANLRIAVQPGTPVIIEVRGEIDLQSAPGLRDELLRVIRRCGSQLVLDLAGVTFMDCAGVSVLLATRRRAQLEDGSVTVMEASSRVRRMIVLLGLERTFAFVSIRLCHRLGAVGERSLELSPRTTSARPRPARTSPSRPSSAARSRWRSSSAGAGSDRVRMSLSARKPSTRPPARLSQPASAAGH